MGWMDRLKGLFSQKEEKPAEKREATLPEFEKWIGDLREIKLSAISDELRNYAGRLEAHKQKIQAAIKALGDAKLLNPNIPVRALNLMEGNRQTYIRITQKIADHIAPPGKYEDLEFFIAQFDDDIADLEKSGKRSFFVLQEFFAKESRAIAASIGEFQATLNDLREFVRQEGIEVIGRIQGEIQGLKKDLALKEEYSQKLAELQKIAEENTQEAKRADDSIMAIKKGEKFAEFMQVENLASNVDSDISRLEQGFLSDFSPLDAALRKYERITEDEEAAKALVGSPISEIQSDAGKKCLGLLAGLSKAIKENRLEIKDEKKGKVLSAIDKLNQQYFQQFLEKRASLMESKKALEERKSQSDQSAEISGLLNAKKTAEQKQADMLNRIKQVELEMQKAINISARAEKIQSLTSELDQAEIILILGNSTK